MKKVINLLFLLPLFAVAQTNGIFGGDAAASGHPHTANTKNQWIKLATMSLNGNYKPGTLQVDFYPDEAPHGDSRQTLLVVLRNGNNDFYEQNSDIVLITHYGDHKTIADAKVIQTGGTGSSNNQFSIWVQMGASWVGNVPIEVRTTGNVTCYTTHQPYYTDIQETGILYELTATYGMFKNKFGIGTNRPDSELTVKGSIHAEEVKVDLSVPAPDYVFEPDYNLTSLEDIEKYILSNKHLPEIPSSKEMEVNGIQLGEMNMLLLKKIEELTLYIIEQEKRIKKLENQPK